MLQIKYIGDKFEVFVAKLFFTNRYRYRKSVTDIFYPQYVPDMMVSQNFLLALLNVFASFSKASGFLSEMDIFFQLQTGKMLEWKNSTP